MADELSPEDSDALNQHIVQRRHAAYWLVPGENLKKIQEIMKPGYDQSESMSEAEIYAAIDEAIAEVRRERRVAPDDKSSG